MVTAGPRSRRRPSTHVVPEKNDGGWVYWLAIALAVLAS